MGIFELFKRQKPSITIDELKSREYEQEYFEECKYIWKNYVPKSGQADNLQGELLRYRDDVGKRTREIISQLSESDMKRKFTSEHRERILMSGGVVSHPESEWLADFWTQKDAAGIILMPLTRHQLLHLNQCGKIKSELTHQSKK